MALALGGCSGTGTDLPDGELSVVFISIDTLRADHVACYGHPVVRTPHIDRLATEGTRFEVCLSSCPLTLPSHSTMMTGTYPFVHGARTNATFVLAEENLTLAEVLLDAGFATHAEIGAAVINADTGMAQGFEGFGDSFIDEQAGRLPAFENSIRVHDSQRRADEVSDAVLAYLASRRADRRPFFLFAHYFDPHTPREAPAPYADQYDDGYLAEIAYTDAQVGRVLDVLREADFMDRTLVLLTSDHGDGRKDHKEFTHGSFLYDSTLLVPLVISCPSRIAGGQTISAQVGLVDLMPTILELVGVSVPPEVQGASLVPLLEDPALDLPLMTYSETLEPRMTFGYSELRSLRASGWKYIHGPGPELYKVAQDPGETANRVDSNPRRVAEMRATLRELIANAPPLLGRGVARELDFEDVQQLAALGYAADEGQAEGDDPHLWTDELEHFEPRGINPMERARDIFSLYAGLGALRDGKFESGVENWSYYVKSNPTDAAAHSCLGQCYAALGRRAAAIPSLRRALELDPERCDDYQILGSLLAEGGDHAEARIQFERALACHPDHIQAGIKLARLLLLLEDHEAALEVLDRALERSPGYWQVHSLRGQTLRELGRDDEALQGLRTAVELEPRDPSTRMDLASLLERTERLDEAQAVHDESVRLLPRNAPIRAAAAGFWIERGVGARALQLLESGLRDQPRNQALSVLRVRVLATDPDPKVRNGERALRLAKRLLQGTRSEGPRVLAAVATAMAETGDFEQAIDLAQRAARQARESGAEALMDRIETELTDYRNQRPVRSP